tara:strand:- start:81 stop:326 length:246 start_codon:yes stop_codon:yes gene_type:complete
MEKKMTNVIKLNPNIEKFKIEITFDSGVMEVISVKYPRVFKKLNGLTKADLIADLQDMLEKTKQTSLNDYFEEVKNGEKND